MDEQGNHNVNHVVGMFSDISVNDSLISSSALRHNSSICNFPLKCEDDQGSDEVKNENNGVCGNDLEQDPLLLNEEDLSRKINLEVTDSTSSFPSKIKKEEPDNILNQDPLLLTEQDYVNFAKSGGKDKKINVEDINKTTFYFKDPRVVLERIDILAASLFNGNENKRSLAKVTSFPITKGNSGDVLNIVKEKEKETAQKVDSVDLFYKDVVNPIFSKTGCQAKSPEQSIVCGNCQGIKHHSHVPYILEAQKNNVNKMCECESSAKGNQTMRVPSHAEKEKLTTHKSLMLFLCSYCGNTFSSKTKLSKHIMTHSGEKPFQCSYCEYRCSLKQNLKNHILTHTGEKPFKCSYCEYRCSLKQNLKNHILTHTRVKPFKCAYCEYRCISKGSLKRHILTHTGEKPFKCSYCEYRYTRREHLKRHILTHTTI